MTLAPDNRAWKVSYKQVEELWFAEFMIVDLEYDGLMASMFINCDGQYELTFHSKGSQYFILGPQEFQALNLCVEEAYEELMLLGDTGL